jgi:4'-phosphopantetheinyl transferase
MTDRLYWLLRSSADHPALGRGEAPPGLLHPQEEARLAALRVPKRRHDWLLGRWTAKHLVQGWLEAATGERPPPDRLQILADPDGAPYAALCEWAPERRPEPQPEPLAEPEPQRLAASLSISHSGQWSFCALCDEAGRAVGADIERIEPRTRGFAEAFFTAAELAAFDAAGPDWRDVLTTATWCAKEAVLKALRLGLRADTRQVICRLAEPGPSPRRWSRLVMETAPALQPAGGPMAFAGWWAINEGYALALVVAGRDLPMDLPPPAPFEA